MLPVFRQRKHKCGTEFYTKNAKTRSPGGPTGLRRNAGISCARPALVRAARRGGRLAC